MHGIFPTCRGCEWCFISVSVLPAELHQFLCNNPMSAAAAAVGCVGLWGWKPLHPTGTASKFSSEYWWGLAVRVALGRQKSKWTVIKVHFLPQSTVLVNCMICCVPAHSVPHSWFLFCVCVCRFVKNPLMWSILYFRFAESWALLKWTTSGCSSQAAKERTCGWTWGIGSASRWITWLPVGWGCGSSFLWSPISFCKIRQGMCTEMVLIRRMELVKMFFLLVFIWRNRK